MLRVNRNRQGPRKGKIQLPSELGGNSEFTEVADTITEQFDIITEGKTKASFQAFFRNRMFAIVLLLGIAGLLLFSAHTKKAKEVSKSSFSSAEYRRTELSTLNAKYQVAIKMAEDSFFTNHYQNIIKESQAVEGNESKDVNLLRDQVKSTKAFYVYQSYVSNALKASGLVDPRVDQIKMFLEAEIIHGYADRLQTLKIQDELTAITLLKLHIEVPFTTESWRYFGFLGCLLLSVFLTMFARFFMHMGFKDSKYLAKRFLALEAYKLMVFNVVAVEDHDLDGLCFVQRSKYVTELPGFNPPLTRVDESFTELSSLNSSRYI